MVKKDYTILIASQKSAKVKKFILSPLTLKIAAGTLGILIIVSGFMAYKYMIFKTKVTELQTLRAEARAQQAEIRVFMEKISILEEQLDKLKKMEKQVEQDLKEVIELKKNKKVTRRFPKKTPPMKKPLLLPKNMWRSPLFPGRKRFPFWIKKEIDWLAACTMTF